MGDGEKKKRKNHDMSESEDASEESEDASDVRTIATLEKLTLFDGNFNSKRWNKLTQSEQKQVSCICHLTKDELVGRNVELFLDD